VRELLSAVAEGERPPGSALATVNAASEGSPASPLLMVEPASKRGAAALRRVESDGDDSPARLLGRLARATIELLTGPDAAPLREAAGRASTPK
jgi:Putative stress-induced transcription regulator